MKSSIYTISMDLALILVMVILMAVSASYIGTQKASHSGSLFMLFGGIFIASVLTTILIDLRLKLDKKG
jgi:hypothetical protein